MIWNKLEVSGKKVTSSLMALKTQRTGPYRRASPPLFHPTWASEGKGRSSRVGDAVPVVKEALHSWVWSLLKVQRIEVVHMNNTEVESLKVRHILRKKWLWTLGDYHFGIHEVLYLYYAFIFTSRLLFGDRPLLSMYPNLSFETRYSLAANQSFWVQFP